LSKVVAIISPRRAFQPAEQRKLGKKATPVISLPRKLVRRVPWFFAADGYVMIWNRTAAPPTTDASCLPGTFCAEDSSGFFFGLINTHSRAIFPQSATQRPFVLLINIAPLGQNPLV
jgi:hypothetical protein